MKQMIRTALSLGCAAMLGAVAAPDLQAQLIDTYTSQEEVSRATDVAQDSISPDAVLIAIATAGEIELAPIGLPGSVAGFSDEDGTSSVWAYQFSEPTGQEEGAVVIVKSGIFPRITQIEEGNVYGVAPRELDLSGSFAGSDQFAAQLRANSVYNEFVADYPEMLPDAIVFTWEPDEELASIPTSFPESHPI